MFSLDELNFKSIVDLFFFDVGIFFFIEFSLVIMNSIGNIFDEFLVINGFYVELLVRWDNFFFRSKCFYSFLEFFVF